MKPLFNAAKQRAAEMKELRKRVKDGDEAAARQLRVICRRGMLVPYWEGDSR